MIKDPITGNYVCVGSSVSAGEGLEDAYIVIFDGSLNLLSNKLIGIVGSDEFNSIFHDTTTGSYICVGHNRSAGALNNDDFIIMSFLSDLSIADGAIAGLPTLIVTSPTLTEATPAFTETYTTY